MKSGGIMVKVIEGLHIQKRIEEALFEPREWNTNYGILSELKIHFEIALSKEGVLQTTMTFFDNCQNYKVIEPYQLKEVILTDERFIEIMEYIYSQYPEMIVYSWGEEEIGFKFYNENAQGYKSILIEMKGKHIGNVFLETYKQRVITSFYSRLIECKTFSLIINAYYEQEKRKRIMQLTEEELGQIFAQLTEEEKVNLIEKISPHRFYELQDLPDFLEKVKQLEGTKAT